MPCPRHLEIIVSNYEIYDDILFSIINIGLSANVVTAIFVIVLSGSTSNGT